MTLGMTLDSFPTGPELAMSEGLIGYRSDTEGLLLGYLHLLDKLILLKAAFLQIIAMTT